ncbi:MAG: DNA cytosine methyltransferase [Sulfolobales archaeon]
MKKRESYLGVVDLFSGAGGFARGFENAGFRIVLGVDNDRSAIKSFKLNFPHAIALNEDIKDVTGKDIIDLLEYSPRIIIGSPPCEPFTGANPNREKRPLDRLFKDPIGQLTLHFIRIVSEIKPDIFVMENVPALAERDIKFAIEDLLRKAGYKEIYFNILRAEDYGTPSHRTRVFVSNIKIKPQKSSVRKTVWEAISDLSETRFGDVPNHEIVYLSSKKLKKVAKIERGKALYVFKGSGNRRFYNYLRLDPYDIAPTIMGSSRFIHPFEDRLLTVREQARLMGFPDNHIFIGGKDEQYNQVGEAVPPPLAEAIAKYIHQYYVNKSS